MMSATTFRNVQMVCLYFFTYLATGTNWGTIHKREGKLLDLPLIYKHLFQFIRVFVKDLLNIL